VRAGLLTSPAELDHGVLVGFNALGTDWNTVIKDPSADYEKCRSS
jgi:hypothetical protein